MEEILDTIKNRKIILILMLIPFIYTYSMFFGFSGALPAQDYPYDYYETDQYLADDPGDFNTLILPWHGYMDYAWNRNADKRLANVARSFFTKPAIAGDNMEVGGIYSSSDCPRSHYVESILGRNTTGFGKLLVLVNVKYIILKKEVDYKKYLTFLEDQQDLTLVKNTTNLLLYKNQNHVYKIYQADDPAGRDAVPLDYEKLSPTRYSISVPDMKYVVFTEPYSESWSLGASSPIEGQVVNVFEHESGGEIRRSAIPLFAGCLVSLAAFMCLVMSLRKTA